MVFFWSARQLAACYQSSWAGIKSCCPVNYNQLCFWKALGLNTLYWTNSSIIQWNDNASCCGSLLGCTCGGNSRLNGSQVLWVWSFLSWDWLNVKLAENGKEFNLLVCHFNIDSLSSFLSPICLRFASELVIFTIPKTWKCGNKSRFSVFSILIATDI